MNSTALQVVVFVAGAVVLALELLCPRFLAPAFGAGYHVWSSVITTTLAALALGYWKGGAVADAGRPVRALTICLAGAGVWILALYFLRTPFIEWCLPAGVLVGPLIAATLLMFVPLSLLGAIGPIALRLFTQELGRVGREAGRVSGLSTAGSIAGALVTGLLLIPNFRGGTLLLALGGVLLALAALVRISARWASAALALTVGVAWFAGTHATGNGEHVRHFTNSIYSSILVEDRADLARRTLYLDGLAHTVVSLPELENQGEIYTAFELPLFLRPQARSALVVGLGGGVIPRAWHEHYGVRSDVVEIDPAVVDVAVQWFGFEPSGSVFIDDGRRHLRHSTRQYDILIIDAASAESLPFHLFTLEAFRLYRERLTGEGILALNVLNSMASPRGLELASSVLVTLDEVFEHVAMLRVDTRSGPAALCENLLILASAEPLEYRTDPRTGRPALARYFARIAGRPFESELRSPEGENLGRVLLDDDCPVDRLSARALFAFRAKSFSGTGPEGRGEIQRRLRHVD